MLVSFGANNPSVDKRPGDVCRFDVTKSPADPVVNDKGETIIMPGDQLLQPATANRKQGAVVVSPAEAIGAQGGKVYLTRHNMACHGYSEQDIEQAYNQLKGLANRDPTKAPLLEQLHKMELGEYLRDGAVAEIKEKNYPKAHLEAALKQARDNASPGELGATEKERLEKLAAQITAAK
jgi:hypothetical protein